MLAHCEWFDTEGADLAQRTALRRRALAIRPGYWVHTGVQMAWWSRTQGLTAEAAEPKKSVPKGIWTKCERCSTTIYDADLDANLRVCASCGHHFRMSTEQRIAFIADEGTWQEHDLGLEATDPLGFRVDGKKYADSVKAQTKKVGPGDAYRAATAQISRTASAAEPACTTLKPSASSARAISSRSLPISLTTRIDDIRPLDGH